MIIALCFIAAFFVVVFTFLVAPVRISVMVSGDLYNGGAGLDASVLPFGGAFGAGVLRPEGGEFTFWIYVFGRRLFRIPLPQKDKKGRREASDDVPVDFEVEEAVEPVDIEDIGDYSESPLSGKVAGEARVAWEEPPGDKDSGPFETENGRKKDDRTKAPRKSLMERFRTFRENAGKYWRWITTALGDFWYIVRIELLSGQVTVGLVNHPATVGSIMGGFAALNGMLPRPFRISVRSEFTRTALEGRIETDITVYLHRFWYTIFRRRGMLLDMWREYRRSQAQEAEILGVEDADSETTYEQPANAV